MTDLQRVPGFKGEYLWELYIAEYQLNALACAIPAEKYGWAPAETARSVSQVLVHIAAGNLLLLDYVGHRAPDDLYGTVASDANRFFGLIRRSAELEHSINDKAAVIELLRRSFDAVTRAFRDASESDLDCAGDFFGERTTVRRVYLRILAHSHEHMGQLIGYTRAMGLPAPWPDPKQSMPA